MQLASAVACRSAAHPPLTLLGVSTGTERGCRQNNSTGMSCAAAAGGLRTRVRLRHTHGAKDLGYSLVGTGPGLEGIPVLSK